MVSPGGAFFGELPLLYTQVGGMGMQQSLVKK
jgi:hypothetical protein